MCEKIFTNGNEETCECLYGSFAHIFFKVAHIRATPSRLQRLVSIIQRFICESTCQNDEICTHHKHAGVDSIATLIVDCLCCSRALKTLDTTETSIQSSRTDSSGKRKHQSPEVVLRCMYALSHVLRECKTLSECSLMKGFVDIITRRSEEIGHAIRRISPEHVYESKRIQKILYLWRQEGVLNGTGVVRKLLAWHARTESGGKIGRLEKRILLDRIPRLEQDIFERRMRNMEHASSHVMYMKHPLVSCE